MPLPQAITMVSSSSPAPRGRNSEPVAKSPLTCILDESFSSVNLDGSDPIAEGPKNGPSAMDQTSVSHQVTTGRFTWGNVKNAVGRSLSPIRRIRSIEAPTKNFRRRGSNESYTGVAAPARIPRRGSNESAPVAHGSPRRRKLPPRQGTFDTAASGCSLISFEDEREKQWAEERLELLEKIEALESKLQSKEAVMKSLMLTAAQSTNSCASQSTSSLNNAYPVGPLASLVMEKEKELAILEATVKHQAMYIEQMELEQEQAVRTLAEELFHEWQQEECQDVSVWEQWQEQEERIATLQAENEHVKQLHQRQSRQMNRLVEQILKEKKGREEQEEGAQQPPPQPRRSSLPDLVPCGAAENYQQEEGSTPSTATVEPMLAATQQQPYVALGYGVQDEQEVSPRPVMATRRCFVGDTSSARTLSTSNSTTSSSDRTMAEVLMEETQRVKTRLRRLSAHGGGIIGGLDGSASSRSGTNSTLACSK